MGLTSALYSTLTGLNANQARLDVIGNNISNVNTIGFKSSRVDFETLFSQTVSNGSAPNTDSGGTNPVQVGLGVKEGATTRNFTEGSRQVTGNQTDLAIEGDGFFILQQGGDQAFTRDGTFKLNSDHQLTSASGALVQGYGVDSSFNVVPGTLTGITIDSNLTVAEPTTQVSLTGSFNANAPIATTTSYVTSQNALYLAGAGTPSATPPAATDLLTNIVDASNLPLFNLGDKVNFTPPNTGASTGLKTLTVTSTTTLQDFMDFMSGTLGIDTAAGANGAAPDGGVTIQAVVPPTATFPANSVQLAVRGNLGTANNISLTTNAISIPTGAGSNTPFSWFQAASADGGSASQNIHLHDSLGNQLNLNIVAVLTSRTSAGTVWQYYATSADGSGGLTTGGIGTQSFVGSGTLTFDNLGNLVKSSTPQLTIDRSNTGAVPKLTFDLAFSNTQALAGSSTTSGSSLIGTADGSAPGTLAGYAIENDGTVKGSFSNGLTRTLAQVALATFQNNQGLVDNGNNTFVPGANSGLPSVSAPGQFSTGTIVAGSLELSNVDLSQEFVNLISASTGFSASSRIITTANQLLQELLQSAR